MLLRADNVSGKLRSLPSTIAAGSGDVTRHDDIQPPSRGGLPPRTIRQVREYILAHLAEDVSNSVLAKFVGLSACHFSRAFKQSIGVSPGRFVLQRRIDNVKHLLIETELSIAQIAVTVGFSDQSHCSRRFRKVVGMTPSRFRWLAR